MIRILFCACVLFNAALNLNAQNVATPNPGFEDWTFINPPVGFPYDSLNNWQTLNYKTAALGQFTASKATGVDKHSGQRAIKLVTKFVFNQTANGVASTGNLITSPPYGVDGGIPYTDRPDSIVGWFKNVVVGSDTAFIELRLTDAAGTTMIGYANFDIVASHSAYSRFSAPVIYNFPSNPALSIWLLSSSARIDVNRQVSSTLYVDDVDLIFNPIGISELEKNSIAVFYNSNSQSLQLQNIPEQNFSIVLFTTDGKTVFNSKIGFGNSILSTNLFIHSNLLYAIFNSKGEKIKGGKLPIN